MPCRSPTLHSEFPEMPLKKLAFIFALFVAGSLLWNPAVIAAPKAAATVSADTEDELYEGKEELPGENFKDKWPSLTRITDMLPARTIQDGPDEWIYETQHFRFTSNAPIALAAIKDIARVFEGTYTANLTLPLNSPCNHYQVCEKGKFKAYLYETYENYLAAGGPNGSAGVYIRRGHGLENGRVLVPFTSLGLEKRGKRYVKSGRRVEGRTLAHEITHHMTLGNQTFPIWFVEGIAEYVGLSYDGNGTTRFTGNKSVISKYVAGYGEKGNGGRAIGKTPRIGTSLEQFMLKTDAFIGSRDVQIGYGFSALLVYYFFHLDGKRDAARIKKFIDIIQKGGSFSQANEALLDGRSWEQLEKEVKRRLKSVMKVDPQFS